MPRARLTAIIAGLLAAVPARAAPPVTPDGSAPAADMQPALDTSGVTLYPDQGRLDLRGTRLLGARVRWQAGSGTGPSAAAGEAACLDVKPAGKLETCSLAVARDLPAGTAFTLAPAPAPASTSAPASFRAARVILDRLLPATAAVDLTTGVGRIPLGHPEAVAAVDCSQARCELTDSAVLVRAVAGTVTAIGVRLRLAPSMFVARGDALDTTAIATVPVLHCAAAIVSGPPLRRAEATRIIVRVDARCGRDARELRWTVNGAPAVAQRSEAGEGVMFVQLGVAELQDAEVTVTASRPEPDDTVVALARSETRPAPQLRAVLELPGFGRIGFLPTNRDAVVRAPPAGDHARFVPLPVDGAYAVTRDGAGFRVRGEEGAAGVVALRFGYRADGLPPAFADTDLGVLTEPLQRPIREASVPAPLGSSLAGASPLLELVCADAGGRPRRIAPGARATVPFAQRDSCRLLIHRERLGAEMGTQDVTVDVDVTKVDDAARADAHVSERMALRPGHEPRVFWIRGVRAAYDRLTVRVSHVVDEAHDVGGADLHVNLPAAQWAVVFSEGRARFYATAAIPTGLFRITAPSDVLTLNFGALSRLTWLTAEGREGLLGLELGALGIGLAATPGFPRTLAVLGGLGVGIPIGNRGEQSQASVNLHAWLAYELRGDYPLRPGDPASPLASHWSLLFGPSITIGNVGTNL